METAVGDGEELGEGGKTTAFAPLTPRPATARQRTRAGKEVDAAERRAKRALTAMDAASAGRRPTRSPRTLGRSRRARGEMAEVRRPLSESDGWNSPRGGEDQRHGEHLTASAAQRACTTP